MYSIIMSKIKNCFHHIFYMNIPWTMDRTIDFIESGGGGHFDFNKKRILFTISKKISVSTPFDKEITLKILPVTISRSFPYN